MENARTDRYPVRMGSSDSPLIDSPSRPSKPPDLLRVRCKSWEEFSRFFDRYPDGSRVFIPSIAPLSAESTVDLRLCSPDGTEVSIGARVVHSMPPPGTGRPGMVLELDALREAESHRAQALLARSVAPERIEPVSVRARGVNSLRPSKAPSDPKILLARLQKHARAIERMDDTEVLKVSDSADLATVKSAYRAQCGQFHPHRFAKYDSEEITQAATQIFVRVQTAHLRLTDPMCSRGAASDRNRAALRSTGDLGEIAISDARRLLEMFQFDAAEDILQQALGTAGDTQRVERFLLLTRARRSKQQGDLQAALRFYRELLLLDPDNDEARSEVELLATKLAPRGLGRVLKW